MGETLDKLYYKVGTYAGVCVPPVENLDDMLEHAENLASDASATLKFVGNNGSLASQLTKGADAIHAIRGPVGKVKWLCVNLEKMKKLGDALETLNNWKLTQVGGDGQRTSNQDAAKAFDEVFGVAGYFAGKLPAPLNQYSKILDGIGVSHFFENMQDVLDPRSANTPKGRLMRQTENPNEMR